VSTIDDFISEVENNADYRNDCVIDPRIADHLLTLRSMLHKFEQSDEFLHLKMLYIITADRPLTDRLAALQRALLRAVSVAGRA